MTPTGGLGEADIAGGDADGGGSIGRPGVDSHHLDYKNAPHFPGE